MSKSRHLAAWSLSVAAALAAGGCGGSGKESSSKTAIRGGVSDNQVFLVFHNRSAGYSIKYPGSWTRLGSGGNVRFKEKDNVIHIVVVPGTEITAKSAAAELAALEASSASLKVLSAPRQVTIEGKRYVKSTYKTESATDKRVALVVDRYQFAARGRKATVDLGTPKGVDNVDAYRLMIESFRWASER